MNISQQEQVFTISQRIRYAMALSDAAQTLSESLKDLSATLRERNTLPLFMVRQHLPCSNPLIDLVASVNRKPAPLLVESVAC